MAGSLPTLKHILSAPQRDNAEGYVLRFNNGMRVKIKHDEYVRLHRILTGVSTKTIWEHLSQNIPLASLIDAVPDEFYAWVHETVAILQAAYRAIEDECRARFDEAVKVGAADTDNPRRGFARAVAGYRYAPVLFSMLDGRDYSEYIWKQIRPVYERPFRTDVDG